MNIMINKEYLDDLIKYTRENADFICMAAAMHICDDELVSAIERKLHGILYFINRAYNPELIELEGQFRVYYQKWLSIKDTNEKAANAIYLEYMALKFKIDGMDIPF